MMLSEASKEDLELVRDLMQAGKSRPSSTGITP